MVSTDNYSEILLVRDKSLPPENNSELTAANETKTHIQKSTAENTTNNTNLTLWVSKDKLQTWRSMKRGQEHFSPIKQENTEMLTWRTLPIYQLFVLLVLVVNIVKISLTLCTCLTIFWESLSPRGYKTSSKRPRQIQRNNKWPWSR